MLFKLIYKQRSLMRDALIDASSLEKATALGEDWCTQNNAKFVAVIDPILIREKPTPPGVVLSKK